MDFFLVRYHFKVCYSLLEHDPDRSALSKFTIRGVETLKNEGRVLCFALEEGTYLYQLF